jgi:two-component system phosphate regulon sensor histidine kinase PhoR
LNEKSRLKRIALILLILILLPAILYTTFEFNSLNQNEQMIYDIYRQQLDVILFSLNQYIWDYVNDRANKLEDLIYKESGQLESADLQNFLDENNSIVSIFISDTLIQNSRYFSNQDVKVQKSEKLKSKLEESKNLIKRLQQFRIKGYRKIETLPHNDSNDSQNEKMVLFYLPERIIEDISLIAMLINNRTFISDIITPKLEEIAGEQFSIGVFALHTDEVIYSNADILFSDVKQTKKLWLFPNYVLGIRTKGKSIDELAKDRFYNSLYLIVFLDIILILGALFVYRNIRREMKLAQMKSDFVSNVSHELRTPLSLIRMFAETLEMGRIREDSKRMDYYRIINQETERLTRLINNILNFSRIESGKKEYHFKPIDLNECVQKVIDMYSFHIQNEGFRLNVNLQENLPLISADEEAISESLINLLDNAIKFSNKNKEISVRTGSRQNSVTMEVQDHGIGISEENRQLIFDKFYRVSSGDVHDTKGSGLGLALVQHIMQSHNGQIEVDSEVGKGSCFRLKFPLPGTD